MLRVGFAVLLVLHGLAHLPGFVKAWGLTPLPEIKSSDLFDSLRGQRWIGVLWAAACAAQLGSAALLLAGSPRWWMAAAATLLLSQLLIIGAWSSARAGTMANVLLVPPLVLAAAMSLFHDRTDVTVRQLRAATPKEGAALVVTHADLAGLPTPVERWLEGSGIVGRPRVRSVRLWQRGALRTTPDGAWMRARARQDFTVDEPGFVWGVEVLMLNVVPVVGRDSYVDGRGGMVIKLGGVVPLVDARGPKIDQGTMLRYLGEIVWFPSAALSPYIHWEAVDADRAKATMTDKGASVSATFTFDASGRVLNVAAERYKGAGEEAVLQRWEVPCRAWRRLADDILVPVEGSVVWKEASGDFDYFRWEITDIQTDPRADVLSPLAQGMRQRS